MKKYILTFVIGAFLLFPLVSHAQLLEVKQTVFGMDCAPCAYGLEKRIQGMEGVLSATVSLNEGLLIADLKENNQLTLKQIREAVEESGFQAKEATIAVAGKVIRDENGGFILETASGERFVLEGGNATAYNKEMNQHYIITGKAEISESGGTKLSIQSVDEGKA